MGNGHRGSAWNFEKITWGILDKKTRFTRICTQFRGGSRKSLKEEDSKRGSGGRPSYLQVLRLLALGMITCLGLQCTKKAKQSDDSLHMALSANIKGLDPIQSNDAYSHLVVRQIYEGLMSYHYLKAPPGVKAPNWLAKCPRFLKMGSPTLFKLKRGSFSTTTRPFPRARDGNWWPKTLSTAGEGLRTQRIAPRAFGSLTEKSGVSTSGPRPWPREKPTTIPP